MVKEGLPDNPLEVIAGKLLAMATGRTQSPHLTTTPQECTP